MMNNNTQVTEIAELIADWVGEKVAAVDTEATMTLFEQMMRESLQEAGRMALEMCIQNEAKPYPEQTIPCGSCEKEAVYQRKRPICLHTVYGRLRVKRSYYLCECGCGVSPLDRRLGLRPNQFSAELNRLVGMVGVNLPYGKGSGLFEQLMLLSVSDPKMGGACVEIGDKVLSIEEEWIEKAHDAEWLREHERKRKGEGRLPLRYYGAIDAGKVHLYDEESEKRCGWRDIKQGVWFTAKGVPPSKPDEAWTIRAENLSYFVDIAPASEFKELFWASAVRHDAQLADELIMLGDGATWIWNLVSETLPHAVQILDWFHAAEYLTPLAPLVSDDEDEAATWLTNIRSALWNSELDTFFDSLAQLEQKTASSLVTTAITYFENNRERIRYDYFRKQGYQIGSGTIESAVKQICSLRMKVPGATWTEENARRVAKARAAYLTDEWASLPLAI